MKLKALVPGAVVTGLILASGAMPGCNCSQNNNTAQFHRDLSGGFDLLMAQTGDGNFFSMDGSNACGDFDPSCTVVSAGPTGMPSMPFPLPSDDPPPTNVKADGVGRDPTGAIILDSAHATFDFLWVADDTNYNVGFISKISTKPRTPPAGAVNGRYNEVARYVSVTCYSDNTPANWPDRTVSKLGMDPSVCDGTKGCCDNAAPGARTPVQLIVNHPSRTAVDFNGDMWVANRAHIEAPHQSSVTKIANRNDPNPMMSDCIDRNLNGKIDTSSDANGDGIIDTDCNQNNIPDDLLDTDPTKGGTACLAGHPQEFFGLDDECILFTTNTGSPTAPSGSGGWGRPLALGTGSNGDFGPSDAWAGRYQDGTFFRINGKTGAIITSVKIPTMPDPLDPVKVCASVADCAGDTGAPGGTTTPSVQCVSGACVVTSHPYGAAVDQFGILWAPNVDGHFLFYFDTNDPNNPTHQGVVGAPVALGYDGLGFYGTSIDGYQDKDAKLVQQVWMAQYGGSGGAFRYRPARTAAFSDLAKGTWAYITFNGPSFSPANGRGIAVDNRTPANAWVGLDASPGGVGRIAADVADGASMSDRVFRAGAFAGNTTLGVGVANNLDIWGVNQGDSSLTHYSVAANADLTAADKILLSDNPRLAGGQQPNPYTYSDFTGFGLRNFTNPRGYYQWTQTGCNNGQAGKTQWMKIVWDADVPNNTSVEVRVRSADDIATLNAASFSAPYTMTPANLSLPPALMPNPSGYLQVEFDLTTMQKDVTPKLKGFQVLYECPNGIG